GTKRRDEGHEDDETGIDHQPGDLRDPSDVLDSILFGEAEVLVEAVTNVVPVEKIGMQAAAVELPLDQIGDRGLAGAGEPREPEQARLLTLLRRAGLLVDVRRLPVDVVRPPQGEMQQA